MKVRVKFAKDGAMKFIGHLDVMRFFQKAIRRAGIDIAYSEGFSPHMIMSFANPLGVGITSEGEYFDMQLKTPLTSEEIVCRLNGTMVDGVRVLSAVQVPDEKASKAMSLVEAADYRLRFRETQTLPENWKEQFTAFMERPSIKVLKKTKKGEREMDLRPLVYDWHFDENDSVFMRVSSGSTDNLKPELVLEAYMRDADIEPVPFAILIHRIEVYADLGTDGIHEFKTLEELGQTIE